MRQRYACPVLSLQGDFRLDCLRKVTAATCLIRTPIQSALFMAPTPPALSPVTKICVALAKPRAASRSATMAAVMCRPRKCSPPNSESWPAAGNEHSLFLLPLCQVACERLCQEGLHDANCYSCHVRCPGASVHSSERLQNRGYSACFGTAVESTRLC